MNPFLDHLIDKYPQIKEIANDLYKAFQMLRECTLCRKKIMTCGNGGSAADAEHIVGELMKGFLLKRKLTENEYDKINCIYPNESAYLSDNLQRAIPAVSLVSSVSFTTAFSNDVNPDFIFAQQIYGLGNTGDILIAISTSGNSKNVILASKIARVKNIKVIALTGDDGGELKKHSDLTILAPAQDVRGIQEYHIAIYHCLCAMLEHALFKDA